MIVKYMAVSAFALVAYTAVAQTPTPPPHSPAAPPMRSMAPPPSVPTQSVNPQEQIERTIGSLFVQNTSLLAQVQSLQLQITDLKSQLEAAKKPEEAKEPPK